MAHEQLSHSNHDHTLSNALSVIPRMVVQSLAPLTGIPPIDGLDDERYAISAGLLAFARNSSYKLVRLIAISSLVISVVLDNLSWVWLLSVYLGYIDVPSSLDIALRFNIVRIARRVITVFAMQVCVLVDH